MWGAIAQVIGQGIGEAWDNARFERSESNANKRQDKDYRRQMDLMREQLGYQKEFAQKGIRWKTEDAKQAGLHPLAALGTMGASYSPTSYIPGNRQVSRPPRSRAPEIANLIGQMIDAKIEESKKQNEKITINNITDYNPIDSSQPDAVYGTEMKKAKPVQKVTKEVTHESPHQKHLEAGEMPGRQYYRVEAADSTAGYGLRTTLSQDASEPMESDWFESLYSTLARAVRLGTRAIIPKSFYKELRQLRPKVDLKPGYEWRYRRDGTWIQKKIGNEGSQIFVNSSGWIDHSKSVRRQR